MYLTETTVKQHLLNEIERKMQMKSLSCEEIHHLASAYAELVGNSKKDNK